MGPCSLPGAASAQQRVGLTVQAAWRAQRKAKERGEVACTLGEAGGPRRARFAGLETAQLKQQLNVDCKRLQGAGGGI